MQKQQNYTPYIMAAGLGAVCGGLLVAAFTRAIPRMISQMMAGMMAEMSAGDCDPADF